MTRNFSLHTWFLLLSCYVVYSSATLACTQSLNLPGGDFPNMPISKPDAASCAASCHSTAGCKAYVYHSPGPCSGHGEHCGLPGGCCYLKENVTNAASNPCTCSALMPSDAPLPPAGAKNVLYIVIDDLRPELPPFGHPNVYAPNFERLGNESTVFRRAYCQIAVCSPSRMSFLTGRRPDTTKTWNFINHFRQAYCDNSFPNVTCSNAPLSTHPVNIQKGGAGQCCTDCTLNAQCNYYTYNHQTSTCSLYASCNQQRSGDEIIGGPSGSWDMSKWTSLPQHFKNLGYFTAGTGKIFHTEEGGTGPAPWIGEDPPSWTPGFSMHDVNAVAPMMGCRMGNETTCLVNATLEGVIADGEHPLCDKTIGDDALLKLRVAATTFNQTQRPFFLAVGFRKPHLAFRFPKPYLQFYPPQDEIVLAKQQTMDESVPPIAHRDPCLQQDPYIPMETSLAQQNRLYYHAATSWVDHQLGKVLDELKANGLDDDTLIVLHSDHGWNLGEHGQYEKFTNWELGTRVPLMIKAPWLPQSQGIKTMAFAELVDVYPTIVDLAHVPPPSDDLDGTSLAPVLSGASESVKNYTLSQFPRCPADRFNASNFWEKNACEFVDRSQFPFMGLSIRTDEWRFTEWVRWNETMTPLWDEVVGTELYNHEGDDATDYDAYENVNQASSNPKVVQAMRELLKSAFAEKSQV